MKDIKTDEEFERCKPKDMSPRSCVEYCLKVLKNNKTKRVTDMVVDNLGFEELIGTLLLALDELKV